MASEVQISEAVMEEIRAGRTIEAIKLLRADTGLNLKEAKAIVDERTNDFKTANTSYIPETRSRKLSKLQSSSELSQALSEISCWIDTSNTDHARHLRSSHQLRSGLDRAEIDKYLQDINFSLTEELYELYQWHNGEIILGEYGNPVSFVPLQKAISSMNRHNMSHLPIFIGDQIYYVASSAADNRNSSEIYSYDSLDSWEFKINGAAYAPSITSLMQAVSECVRKYDGMSSYQMAMDKSLRGSSSFQEANVSYTSLLDSICAQYSIRSITDEPGCLWR